MGRVLADANPATPILIVPKMADALPRFSEKGSNASAIALGEVKPRQSKRMKSKMSVVVSLYKPLNDPVKKIRAVNTCTDKAAKNIRRLVYFLRTKMFNWLPPMNPVDRIAKIAPKTFGLT